MGMDKHDNATESVLTNVFPGTRMEWEVIGLRRFLQLIMILCFVTGISLTGYSLFQIGKGTYYVEKRRAEARQIIQKGENAENPESIDYSSISYKKGETIGLLSIPKLDRDLPIIEGVDEEELEMGVGHYTGTGYPLQNDQIILSGHRDTVFRNFNRLEIGDTFIVKMNYGSFEYEIFDTEIVPADDTTVVGKYAGEEILTVTTCYPFSYIGNAPDRFIFYAKPLFETSHAN